MVRACVDLGLRDDWSCTMRAPLSDLTFGDKTVYVATVHVAFMAVLADGYGTVISASEVLGGPTCP